MSDDEKYIEVHEGMLVGGFNELVNSLEATGKITNAVKIELMWEFMLILTDANPYSEESKVDRESDERSKPSTDEGAGTTSPPAK